MPGGIQYLLYFKGVSASTILEVSASIYRVVNWSIQNVTPRLRPRGIR